MSKYEWWYGNKDLTDEEELEVERRSTTSIESFPDFSEKLRANASQWQWAPQPKRDATGKFTSNKKKVQ